MTTSLNRNEVIFEPDFTSARLGDGSIAKFTRLERRALLFFNETAGRILTRSQILDAVSEPGSEKNDRSIDFLINRIRGKLGDSVHEPRFIKTLYGEGYVWLRPASVTTVDYSDIFLVIGPFRSIKSLGMRTDHAIEIAQLLKRGLEDGLRADQKILVAPDVSAPDLKNGPKIAVQLGFYSEGNRVECVVTARHCPSDRLVYVNRFSLEGDLGQPLSLPAQTRLIAENILTRHWQSLAAGGAVDTPLPVAMHNAAELPTPGDSWDDNAQRLKSLGADVSHDPALKMMWATHLHSKYVYKGADLFRTGGANCAQDEAEIERLVMESLNFAQTRPEYAAMAAKLLYFVDRGYRDLALELATMAHHSNSGLTSSLAIVGQLHGFADQMDAAEGYLAQAVEMSEVGSEQQIYALYMLCQAHMAAGAHEKLSVALKRMYKMRPATALVFELFLTDPISPSLRAKAMTLLIKRDRATAMLRQATYISARLYENPKHRENSLLTPVNLFVRRFGPEVVPDEAAMHLPGLKR